MYYDIFNKLLKSRYRSSFKLKQNDIDYINNLGMENIKKHAYEFINKRLKPKYISNDGKQTPFKNHPVFIAQHATGTCCRSCLYKWHHIPKEKELTSEEVNYIVKIIMLWISKAIQRK